MKKSDKEIRKDDSYAQEFTLDELENVSGGDKISYGKGEGKGKSKRKEVTGSSVSFQSPVEAEVID